MISGDALTGADASTNQTSPPIDKGDLKDYAVQIVFTGTPSGTVKIQASIDNVSWADVSGTSTTVTTGAPSPIVINLNGQSYRFARVVWTNSAGTGTIGAKYNLSEIPIPRG